MNTEDFLDHLRSLNIKLTINDDKLKCSAPPGVLTPDLRAELAERKAEILGLLQTANLKKNPKIEVADRHGNFPLSFAQQRLWFLDQLTGANATYNITRSLKLSGKLDVAALEKAIAAIIDRHEILRTTYQLQGDAPAQIISPDHNFKLSTINLQHLSENEQQAEIKTLINDYGNKPFDLNKDLLIRCQLLKLNLEEYIFLFCVHHIVFDGWSMGIFDRELSVLYQDFRQGRSPSLPPLLIQYLDFSIWQKQWLKEHVLEAQTTYWKQQLSGIFPLLQLPYDRPRPPVQTANGSIEHFNISVACSQNLKELAQRSDTTLFMVLFAAYSTLMHRYSHQPDICIGTPIANRTQQQIESLIGFFVNTLVLRTRFYENQTFLNLLKEVRQTALDAYTYQDVPFDQIVQELKPDRDLSYSPLIQVIFALENTPTDALELDALNCAEIEHQTQVIKFDLALFLSDKDDQLLGSWEYNTDLFERETIIRWISHFQVLLESITANPEQKIACLPLLTTTEERILSVDWNQRTFEYPQEQSVHRLFEAQVERTPEAIAVVFEEQELTYRELNDRANQLAHYLQSKGLEPETLVGLCVGRSPAMIIGLLGILKAGGAYVPLDPSYPNERLRYMLEDTAVSILLAQDSLTTQLPSSKAKIIYLESDWPEINRESTNNLILDGNPENLAYINYTSGSTGKPKGVKIPHRGIVRLLFGVDYAEFNASEVFLQMAPISFDAATFEIWGALLHGSKCVLLPTSTITTKALGSAIKKYGITTLWLTSALFNTLLDDDPTIFQGIKQLLTGGEALSVKHIQKALKILPSVQLINGYGPTENTTFTCCYRIPKSIEKASLTSIPIGRPIGNTEVYILNSEMRRSPIGVPGELYVGGAGLAKGYLNKPELTAAKFIVNLFNREAETLLYRTGDLVRYLADGNIEFLGRIDNQVKIRGFRIELGEIEAALLQHPEIKEAVVKMQEKSNSKQLIAYLVPSKTIVPTEQLRSFLQEIIPDYMIPNNFFFLDHFPLTSNGKVDQKALSEFNHLQQQTRNEYLAPETSQEQQMADIWMRALNIERVGLNDNFFELGGHSLLAVKVFSEIEAIWNQELSLSILFQKPTIKELVKMLDNPHHKITISSLVPIQTKGNKFPIFCIHAIGTSVQFYRNLAKHLSLDQPFYGLQSRFLEKSQEGTEDITIEAMAAFYISEIKRIQPEGPYFLGGYSYGGRVVYEMAQQLQASGQEVALLAIFDSAAPGGTSRLNVFQILLKYLKNIKDKGFSYGIKKILGYLYFRSKAFKQSFKTKALNEEQTLNTARYFEKRLMEVEKIHRATMQKYDFKKYVGDLTLFRAENRVENIGDKWEEDLGWGNYVEGELKIYNVLGNHHSLFDEPFVKDLAKQVQLCLDEYYSCSK